MKVKKVRIIMVGGIFNDQAGVQTGQLFFLFGAIPLLACLFC